MTPDMIPVTAVVLCHNEAINLDRCLGALRGVAEIVVVDDGSTDGSQVLASSRGARVVTHRFSSFADQRNWAMADAGLSQDWVLHLDADEIVTPAGLAELRRLLPTLSDGAVGFVARKVMLEERWLRFSTDFPVYVARLVHRRGPRYVMQGHGEIIETPSCPPVFLKEPLLHYVVSKGWPDWWARHQRYARAEAARIAAGLPPVSLRALCAGDRTRRRGAMRALSYRLPGRPVLRFLYAYGLRCGYLDGAAGFAFCRAMAQYERMINRELKSLGTPET